MSKQLYVYSFLCEIEPITQRGIICACEERPAEMSQDTRNKIVGFVKELLAMDGTCAEELTKREEANLLYDLRCNNTAYVRDYEIMCEPTQLV